VVGLDLDGILRLPSLAAATAGGGVVMLGVIYMQWMKLRETRARARG
jgi:hypothetical protein